MTFKLATADFSFPLLEHDRVLDLIAGLGLDGIDIGLFEGRSHLWPSREFKNLKRSANTLCQKLRDRGLRPADVFLQMAPDFVPFAINHPSAARRKKARDWFNKTLEYANILGCKHVTTLPGVLFPGVPADACWARTAEELAWRLEQARAAHITFSVEAHVGSMAPTPRDALRLVRETPGLTLTVDYTHFTRAGIKDSVIEPMLAHASHFHVRGSRKGYLQASFKNNVIDYRRVVKTLKARGYKGYLGIEYVWVDWEHCNEVDNLSETILYRDFLRKL